MTERKKYTLVSAGVAAAAVVGFALLRKHQIAQRLAASGSRSLATKPKDASGLFSKGQVYANYRPSYPPAIYQQIEQFASKSRSGKGKLAVDIGSGTGQATVALRGYYDRVVGVESSDSQRAAAVKKEGVEYVAGTAEKIPVADGTADIVTVAQAAHWFDMPAFCKETLRVLKPGGTLAIWSYAMMHLDNKQADSALLKYHFETMGPFWDSRRKIVDDNYKAIVIPEPAFADVQRQTTEIDLMEGKRYTVGDFTRYLETWSSHTTFTKKHPDKPDPRFEIQKQVLEAYGSTDPETTVVKVRDVPELIATYCVCCCQPTWDVTLILARKPKA